MSHEVLRACNRTSVPPIAGFPRLTTAATRRRRRMRRSRGDMQGPQGTCDPNTTSIWGARRGDSAPGPRIVAFFHVITEYACDHCSQRHHHPGPDVN